MKVICPKCQYENQSSSSQVFCARCATMIDVRSQREASPDREYQSGAPLPYSGRPAGSPVPGAVQPGGRLPGGPLGDDQFPMGGGYHRPPVSSGRERDAYATRVDGDFNDLLEIETRGEREGGGWKSPSGGVGQAGTSMPDPFFADQAGRGQRLGVEPPPVEVGRPGRSARPERSGYSEQRGEPWQSEDSDSSIRGAYTADGRESPPGSSRIGRETREISDEIPSNLMGWPVLTNSQDVEYDDEQDEQNDEIVARQGIGMRIVLGAAVFAGLIGGAYFFLGDLISKRKGQAESLTPSAAESSSPAASPTLSPGLSSQPAIPPVGSTTSSATVSTGGTIYDQVAQSLPVDIPPMAVQPGAGEQPRSTPPPPANGGGDRVPDPGIPLNGDWTIQVGSFNDQGQAGDRQAALRAANLPARISKVEIAGKGTWFRIQIGGFGSREEALRFGSQLRARGAIQDFIATPR